MTQKWWVLSSVACGTFMATLDSSVVNIALPTLTQQLGADLYHIKWVIIIYLLIITCLLLPFGRISDQYGRKFIFQIGFSIFIFGSALCGFSPDLGWLILFRSIQAIGAAMLMSNGPAIIISTFSARERGAALGTLAMVVSAGLLTGPSIGGFFITHFGWRSIFFINVPIGLMGTFLVQKFLKKDTHPRPDLSFDWAGAFLQTFILVLFIVFFDPPVISFSGSPPTIIPRWVVAGIIFFLSVIFFKVESEVPAPLFDLSLLKNRTFWTGNLAGFLTFVSFSSVSILMPFFLEEILLFPPQKAGFFMTAIPVTIFIVAPISGRLSDKVGSQELSFFGAMMGVIGLFMMAGVLGPGIDDTTHHAMIIFELCLIGLAIGLFQSPNNSAIMGSVPTSKLGVASALLATIRNLGLVTSTGVSTNLFTWQMALTHHFISSLHTTFAFAGVVGIGAMLASLARKRR